MSLLCVLLSPVSPGKVKALYDTQTPMCPICHAVLRPGELQEHMEQEMERLMQLRNRYILQFILNTVLYIYICICVYIYTHARTKS